MVKVTYLDLLFFCPCLLRSSVNRCQRLPLGGLVVFPIWPEFPFLNRSSLGWANGCLVRCPRFLFGEVNGATLEGLTLQTHWMGHIKEISAIQAAEWTCLSSVSILILRGKQKMFLPLLGARATVGDLNSIPVTEEPFQPKKFEN